MRKFLFLLPLVTLLFAACSSNSYTIDGKLTENTYEGKTVYLQITDTAKADGYVVLDSAVIKDSKFKLKGTLTKENNPSMGFVSVGKLNELDIYNDQSPLASVILEPGTITLTFDKNSVTLGGTPQNEHFNLIHVSLKELAGLNNVLEDEETTKKKQILIDSIQNTMFSFAKNNAKNKVGEYMILSSIQGQSFTPQQYLELLAATDTSFHNRAEIKQVEQFFNQLIEQEKAKVTMEEALMNQQFKDIELMNKAGQYVNLSDYAGKGKYVLIDFWATWCRPCIEEMPSIADAYAKYKGKGFEVVSISIDESDKLVQWHTAIETLKMTWIQLHDPMGKAADLYGVQSIPATFLVDPDGKIIAMNLRGGQLHEKLNEVLK